MAQKLYLTDDVLKKFHGAKMRWRESRSGTEFTASYEDILTAEYELNRLFILRGAAYLNEFLELLGQRVDLAVDELGWDAVEGWENYGYEWIDFRHWASGDNKLFIIDYVFPPHNIITGQDDFYPRPGDPPINLAKYSSA